MLPDTRHFAVPISPHLRHSRASPDARRPVEWGCMSAAGSNPFVQPFFPLPADPALAAKSPAIEGEVMAMFEEYRDPILRYSLSFGISVHDAGEGVQETFLALFQHLRAGKSRSNLRGWIFRVAHNQSLKHRQAAHLQRDTHTSD